MMILDRLIDKLGNSSPQIFRELKERLTLRNIGITVFASLVIQGFVFLYFNSQLPFPTYVDYPKPHTLQENYSNYCNFLNNNSNYQARLCKLNQLGGFTINRQVWWSNIFTCSSWILGLGLMMGSVYLLVADLIQEEKRGTLNFIRLSPQSAREIFIGKILGVPILVYLAAALMIPLYFSSGLIAGANLPLLTGWCIAVGSLWFLCSSAAVLYVLLGGVQAIVTALAVAYPIGIVIFVLNQVASATINKDEWFKNVDRDYISWFGFSVFSSAIGLYAFMTAVCFVANYWVWQALERRYLNPTATMISKRQSYLINICSQILVAGFAVPLIFRPNYVSSINAFAVMDFTALALLIPMLLPSKQALQDWSRYRRERVTAQRRKFWQRELVQDLLFNDKSPTLLAIAVNIGMAMLLWVPISIVTFSTPSNGIRFLASGCLVTSLILIYAAIAHLVLFLNLKKRNLWIVAVLGALMILPLGVTFLLSPLHSPTGIAAIVLLFSPFAPLGIVGLTGGTILAAFAVQLGILGILTRQLQRKLQISGQSQSKELLAR